MPIRTHLFKTLANLEYLEAGSGKVILLLHGLGSRSTAYKQVINQLTQSYHVYAPSLHFSLHGQSTSTIEDYTSLLNEFIRSKALKDITVIGNSFGGGIALKLAESNNKIARLVLADSAGLPIHYTFTQFLYFLLRKTLHELKYVSQLPLLMHLVRDFLLFFLKSLPQFAQLKKAFDIMSGKELVEFQRIRIPTLLVWGTQDEIFSPEYAKHLHSKLSNSELIFLEGNHDFVLFNHTSFCRAVDKWIGKK
ncbi:alpha/beta hydrolase [Candidatus Roizmanbacteria bacterium]|nr:alpha/beta hydrolase [Candidatus Roizmanbacteria bacterium]